MLLKEFYTGMYGKLITEVDDDQIIKYKDADGESKEMSAKAAKRMSKDHPAKIEYDKQTGDGDKAAKKSVNIFDEPADEPADEPKAQPSGDIQAIGKNTPAKKADDPKVQKVSDYFFDYYKKYKINAGDAAEFAIQHYKALTGFEYDFEESQFPEEVYDFMETVVGEDEDWQDEWYSAEEGYARAYDDGEFKDYSDDIPMGDDGDDGDGGDDLQIGGPNGLEIGRDEIKKKLLDDPEIAKILGDEDDVYWDDADLVSSKHDDATIASIDDESDMTIGDIKKAIKDYREDSDDDMDENLSNKNVNFRSIKENWIKNNL